MNFLFIGERPSPKAEQIGATWQNGKLAGKTLRAALLAAGLCPEEQKYLNLWELTPSGFYESDAHHEAAQVELAGILNAQGYQVIALGQKVARALSRVGVAHAVMVHPAARGSIRQTERYQAHVAQVLSVAQHSAWTEVAAYRSEAAGIAAERTEASA